MDKEGTSSLIGVGIAILANCLISAGLNVERLAHIKRAHTPTPREKKRPRQARPPDDEQTRLIPRRTPSHASTASSKRPRTDKGFVRSPLWLFGFLVINLGEVGNFLAYGFAPTSLVAPLGMTALVANVGLAPAIVGEPFRKKDLVGILICLIGGATVVYASRASDQKITPSQLVNALKQPLFIGYSIACCVVVSVLTWVSRTRFGDRFVLVDLTLCAIAGAFTVLATKALSSFLNLMFLDTFKHPITYPLLIVLLSTAFIQVNFINKSLQRFESRVVIPTQYMTFAVSSIVGSAILYGDFKGMGPSKLLNFGFGCVVSAAGVYLLTRDDGGGGGETESKKTKPNEPRSSSSAAATTTRTTTTKTTEQPSTSTNRSPSSPSSSSSTAMITPVNLSSSHVASASSSHPDAAVSTATVHPHHLSLSLSPTTRMLCPPSGSSPTPSGAAVPPNPAVVAVPVRPGGLRLNGGGSGGGGSRNRKLSIGRFATGGYLLVGSPTGLIRNNDHDDDDREEEEGEGDEQEGDDEEEEEEEEGELVERRGAEDQV